MTPHSPDDEQHLLEHVREHSQARPSAQLDARILAASRAQVAARRPSFWQRLGVVGPRQRWSAAFGCIAVLGLGLGVSLQTLDRVPPRYALPTPPLPAPAAPASIGRQAPLASDAPLAESAAPPRAMARLAVRPAPLDADVLDALREIAALRERGLVQQAEARSRALAQRHPELDIEAQLQRLPPVDK